MIAHVHIAASDPALAGVLAGLVRATPDLALSAQVHSAAALDGVLDRVPADLALVGVDALGRDGGHGVTLLADVVARTRVLLVERRGGRRGALADYMDAGASGVLAMAELSVPVLRAATSLVRDGGAYVSAALAADVLRVTPISPLPDLTARERQVVGLLAEGATTSEVARRLGITRKTVKNHLTNAYAKLQVSSREELGELVAAQQPAA